jgi:SAM-dependent methyltransferase
MAGSGTSLVAAKRAGHAGIGFDLDPLAVLVSRASTVSFSTASLRRAAARVSTRAERVYSKGAACPRYPDSADEETREFIRFWFDETNQRQLSALSLAIGGERRPEIRRLLWCALSRLVIAKERGASLARDLAHSRPHRGGRTSPIKPLQEFLEAVETVASRAPFADANQDGVVDVQYGDARRLPLARGSVDLVICSPPYLNAIDYLRAHKFSLVWMGWRLSELRLIRGHSVGTERGLLLPKSRVPDFEALGRIDLLAPRVQRMAARFVMDMARVVEEIARVLRPSGKAVVVIGEPVMRGVRLRNGRVLRLLAARSGMRLERRSQRQIPANHRYMPPPGSRAAGTSLSRRMNRELVLHFVALG